MDCDSGVVVDDLVTLSVVANNTAVKTVNNLTSTPVIGVVLRKPSSTKCLVLFAGLYTFTIARGRVFIDSIGKLSISAPASGYLQEMGFSFGDGTVLLEQHKRIKRS